MMVFFLLCIILTACMLGPDFHAPDAPNVKNYIKKGIPAKIERTPAAGASGKKQIFVQNSDISAEWWHLFGSSSLNQLINRGLLHSPDITASYAALRQAQEALNVQVGNTLFPAVNAEFAATRERFSGASVGNSGGSSLFNLYNANANVSYTLDLFGGNRRLIEAFAAQVDYQQFILIGVHLTLTANIVTSAITIAALQKQIEATLAIIQAEEKQLVIIKKQFHLGGVSNLSVLSQETLLEQTKATLPPLEKSLSQAKHALSVLVGDFPNQEPPILNLDEINLPGTLPLSLPSDLVRQRPDVRASEALLHAASAQIGVATANLFPQITLNASKGWTNTVLSQLFKPQNEVWNIAAQLTQPVFHGGALFAARRQAIAAYDQALAQYRKTVLQAFQNVADTLSAIENDAKLLHAAKTAEVAASQSLSLVRKQYQLGAASYLNLLVAEQQYQQTVINRIQAQAFRYNDTAALFQALGGGWWHKPWCVKECI